MDMKRELDALGDDIAALEKAGLMEVKSLALRALTRVYRLLQEVTECQKKS